MTNYLYSEESKDFTKRQKQPDLKLAIPGPSKMSMKFILGYSAALRVIKSKSIGKMEFLLNWSKDQKELNRILYRLRFFVFILFCHARSICRENISDRI